MVFDENGRAYVAEMLDLPYDPPPGKVPRGRIRMLEATDGDGKADRRKRGGELGFTVDFSGNLVRHDIVNPDGASFVGHPA